MSRYQTVIEQPQSTILAEYDYVADKTATYQSESSLEQAFISQLQKQAYEYLPIKTEDDLLVNLRTQLQRLNNVTFNDNEWRRFLNFHIANKNESELEKTAKLQNADTAITFTFDDQTDRNIRLLDKRNIHNNCLQVINQYQTDSGNYTNRYDVTVLVNGLPLVHVELKRRGVDIREAFNQIDRYERDSFWSGCGLYEYVQIFVISNGTYTKYYSNTTRMRHLKEQQSGGVNNNNKRSSNSYEFTCWWSDAKNNQITDLIDFTKSFFAKHAILNILTRYCVFDTDKTLLVMRPYQIAATERIINQIELAHNYKLEGKLEAGGYIWHTTGSGKTLTSFKTAQLACQLDYIDKVIFVVDRKDLDYQTMKEYDRFQEGAANGNRSTKILESQIKSNDSDKKLIITTIQKLARFAERNQGEDVMDKHVVLIFDECHRSQFGDMGQLIRKKFKKYYMFGFTGTPIFSKNASTAGKPNFKTTEQTFGKQLHSYTIVNAINDKNVLPFRIDYINTMSRVKDEVSDVNVRGINKESGWLKSDRISIIVKYILEHFDQKTRRNGSTYNFKKTTNISELTGGRKGKVIENKQLARVRGFNSMFATSSTMAARLYYNEFKRQQADLPDGKKLKIATIFSFSPNEPSDVDVEMGYMADESSDSVDGLDQVSRDFLESAIADYNLMFDMNFDTSHDGFQRYYQDVSLRMKNRELDLLIVVDMFLTGFDATTMNTLWVDKNLRMHGLIQAFSRTNRILNSVKTYGNIVCFRNLSQATDDALALFGDKDAKGIVLMRSYDDYMNGYQTDSGRHEKGYVELVQELRDNYPDPVSGTILGEYEQKKLIKLFGNILRARNILMAFDEFSQHDLMSPRELQDQQSRYLDIYHTWREKMSYDKENIADDIVFEIELIKQVDINIDYILELIAKYHDTNQQDREIKINIDKAIGSSIELRSKKELIERFIESLGQCQGDIYENWQEFVKGEYGHELDRIIADENLDKDKTYRFVKNAFSTGAISENGQEFSDILPKMSRFGRSAQTYATLRERVVERLKSFFDRFFSISE